MNAIGRYLLSAAMILLAAAIAAGPFIIPTIADGDPISNSIPSAWLVYFYGIFILLHISVRFCELTDPERKRREWLLDYFPFWSMPLFLGVYWIAYSARDVLGR